MLRLLLQAAGTWVLLLGHCCCCCETHNFHIWVLRQRFTAKDSPQATARNKRRGYILGWWRVVGPSEVGPDMSTEDKVDYLIARFAEDIDTMVKYDEVLGNISVEYIEE